MATACATACCEHLACEHGQERQFYDTDSRREVCLRCPGYEEPGYPRGTAWHRYRPALEAQR